MLSEKVEKALNAQINAEFWSAYLYLSMSADAMQKGYKGIANWFSIQFQEEQAHAQIFVNYVLSRGGKVTLAPIAAVKTEWVSSLEMFQDTLQHEQKVTSLIDELCHIAMAEKISPPRTCSTGSLPNRSRKRTMPARSSTSSRWSKATR